MAGWPFVAESRPNRAHHALARLEQAGHIGLLATQNVDGLHQRAGHHAVIDLHGRLGNDVAIFVLDISLPFLSNAVIDFSEELIGARFVIQNPNATASCGCGTSFSI